MKRTELIENLENRHHYSSVARKPTAVEMHDEDEGQKYGSFDHSAVLWSEAMLDRSMNVKLDRLMDWNGYWTVPTLWKLEEVPCSSSPSEWAFSVAGNTLTQKCCS